MINNSVAVHVHNTRVVVEAEAWLSGVTPPPPPPSPSLPSLTHNDTPGHHEKRFPAGHHLIPHFRGQPS